MRFWDSSALVPLVVTQPSSRDAESWIAQDGSMVLWTLAEIEVASALWRLVREGRLDEKVASRAEPLVRRWVQRSHIVYAVDEVKEIACRLLRMHDLRAADALQLGAALVWADGRPAGLVLATFDRRLARAAAKEGFDVVPRLAG